MLSVVTEYINFRLPLVNSLSARFFTSLRMTTIQSIMKEEY